MTRVIELPDDPEAAAEQLLNMTDALLAQARRKQELNSMYGVARSAAEHALTVKVASDLVGAGEPQPADYKALAKAAGADPHNAALQQAARAALDAEWGALDVQQKLKQAAKTQSRVDTEVASNQRLAAGLRAAKAARDSGDLKLAAQLENEARK